MIQNDLEEEQEEQVDKEESEEDRLEISVVLLGIILVMCLLG